MRTRSIFAILFLLFASSSFAQITKRPVLEMYTGAWSGWSPDGSVIADQVRNTYANAIVVEIHSQDAMSFTGGNTLISTYNPFYPGGTIDRVHFNGETYVYTSRSKWSQFVGTQSQVAAPADVTITNVSWNSQTRLITATVTANFATSLSQDLRLNLWIVEDSVVGSGSGYNQANYLDQTFGHPYYQAGDPIIGFVHRNVCRTYLGGAWGDSGIIPNSNQSGNSYFKTYTYTLPQAYDENQVKLVGILQQYTTSTSTREILNANVTDLLGCLPIAGGFVPAVSNMTATFTDTSAGASSWAWDFGDGNSSTNQNPTYTYTNAGTYTVCLIASNTCSADTICDTVTVSCTQATANYTAIVNGPNVTFTNTSTGSPTVFQWDFGDGNTDTTQSPTHQYPSAGTYTVCLTIDNGCSIDTICQSITTSCNMTSASWGSTASNQTISFSDSSTFNPTGWTWDFGDGNLSTVQNPQYTYAQPGIYTVCLTVSNNCSSDSLCQNVNVTCTAPTSFFVYNTNKLTVMFSDSSLGSGQSWLWDFGDGSLSVLQHPQHTFSSDGTYYVCLTVTDSCGTDQYCDSITVMLVNRSMQIGDMLFEVYPNPAKDQFQVDAKFQNPENLKMKLTDLQGRMVESRNRNSTSKLSETFDVSRLAPGTYILEISVNGHSAARKIIVY